MTRLSFGIERGIYRERQTRQQMKKWSSTNTSTKYMYNIKELVLVTNSIRGRSAC